MEAPLGSGMDPISAAIPAQFSQLSLVKGRVATRPPLPCVQASGSVKEEPCEDFVLSHLQQTPKSWDTNVGCSMLMFLLSEVCGWRTVMFQFSGFYRNSCHLVFLQ